ncbi:MAG: DNA repair protein RecO, partial [Gemmatimonadota bacterium]|nr:DNA repair protein RecO [Gemmatimonadota bacterium]
MPLVATEAIVLHSFDYLESSRVLRLATRDAGVRSVIAKGARRSSRRFGGGLDLFSRGVAHLYTKAGRDLDTLAGFDDLRAGIQLGSDLGRFTGASAIAELTLRFSREASADPALYDAVAGALEAITSAAPDQTRAAVLAGAWRIVAELGFAPALDECAECHATLPVQDVVMFSHPAGGALCGRCSRLARGRVLPAGARAAVRAWTAGGS